MNNEYDEPKVPIRIILGAFIFSLAMFCVGAVLFQSNYGEGNEYISVTIEGCGFILILYGIFGFFNVLGAMLSRFGEYLEPTRFGKFLNSFFDKWEPVLAKLWGEEEWLRIHISLSLIEINLVYTLG